MRLMIKSIQGRLRWGVPFHVACASCRFVSSKTVQGESTLISLGLLQRNASLVQFPDPTHKP